MRSLRPAARAPAPQSANEIEETLKRVSSHPGARRPHARAPAAPVLRTALTRVGAPCAAQCARAGVQGLIVVNADGIPIRTTLDNETSVQARAPPRVHAPQPLR